MKNNNLVVQIASLVLWVFAIAGLHIDPNAVAEQGYTALITANWPLIVVILINFANTAFEWYKTWATNKPNFILFLRSPNWWSSALNVGFSFAVLHGINLPPEAAQRIIELAFSGKLWELAGYLLPSVIAPLVTWLTAKKNAEIKAKAGIK